MDKESDFPDIRELIEEYGYTAHIRNRGEEKAKSLQKAANTMGKENQELFHNASLCMCSDNNNIQSSRTFQIGFYLINIYYNKA
jgi:hypothetical protein